MQIRRFLSGLSAVILLSLLSGCSQEASPPKVGERSGEYVYNTYCFACHNTGAANAPVLSDAEVWNALIKKGEPALLKVSIQGRGAMPRRGSCFDCTDEEIQRALHYMLQEAIQWAPEAG